MMKFWRRLIWVLLLLFLIGSLWLLSTLLPAVLESRRIAEGRTAAATQFGEAMLDHCNTLTRPKQPSQIPIKVIFVDAAEKTLSDSFNNALPSERRANTSADLEGIICLKPVPVTVDTLKYAVSATDPNPYYCTMIRRDLEAYLLNAKTGQPLAFRLLEGGDPPACPSRATASLTQEGAWPSPTDAVKWITGP